MKQSFFANSIEQDAELADLLDDELVRQNQEINLIASENFISPSVMAAQGSVLSNKYAEGYPGKRYYGGCQVVDQVENLAIERAKKLFGCEYVNVQPHSGSQANQTVYNALLSPGDTILGMSLDAGGHLTHGAKPNQSGKWFHAVQYGCKEDGLLDYEALRKLAHEHKPKLIIAGASAYPRNIDFAAFKNIAQEVGAYLLCDIAHYAGLVVCGRYTSPFPHADIVTTTTHKTLRGARGGMVMTNDAGLFKKINSALFPGLQGGPLLHVIAGKAAAFHECLQADFADYIDRVLANAQAMAKVFLMNGMQLVTGGTESHLILLDLRNYGMTGKEVEEALGKVNITCNKNTVPMDPNSPFVTSGIRLGSAACTTRGFNEEEFAQIAMLIVEAISCMRNQQWNEERINKIRKEVQDLCDKSPIYNIKHHK